MGVFTQMTQRQKFDATPNMDWSIFWRPPLGVMLKLIPARPACVKTPVGWRCSTAQGWERNFTKIFKIQSAYVELRATSSFFVFFLGGGRRVPRASVFFQWNCLFCCTKQIEIRFRALTEPSAWISSSAVNGVVENSPLSKLLCLCGRIPAEGDNKPVHQWMLSAVERSKAWFTTLAHAWLTPGCAMHHALLLQNAAFLSNKVSRAPNVLRWFEELDQLFEVSGASWSDYFRFSAWTSEQSSQLHSVSPESNALRHTHSQTTREWALLKRKCAGHALSLFRVNVALGMRPSSPSSAPAHPDQAPNSFDRLKRAKNWLQRWSTVKALSKI